MTEDKDNAITPESFGKINSDRKQRQMSIFNNTQGMSKITPEYVQSRINGIASDDMPTSSAAYQSLVYRVEDLAEAYLKLHEENARLQNELNIYTSTDGLTAAKMYNMEMGLRHEVEKENTRLQKENEILQNALMTEEEEVRRLREALEKIENSPRCLPTGNNEMITPWDIAHNALEDTKP